MDEEMNQPLNLPEASEVEQYLEMINMVKESNTNLELQVAKLRASNKKLIQMCAAQHAELETLRAKAPKLKVVSKADNAKPEEEGKPN